MTTVVLLVYLIPPLPQLPVGATNASNNRIQEYVCPSALLITVQPKAKPRVLCSAHFAQGMWRMKCSRQRHPQRESEKSSLAESRPKITESSVIQSGMLFAELHLLCLVYYARVV